jgi:hypothetical protein
MRDLACGLRRTPLPRTRVHKGKKKGQGFDTLAALLSAIYLGRLCLESSHLAVSEYV